MLLENMLHCPCNVLIPASVKNAITKENANGIQGRIVAESAKGPTTPTTEKIV